MFAHETPPFWGRSVPNCILAFFVSTLKLDPQKAKYNKGLASNPQASHFVAVVVLVRGSKAPPLTPSVRRIKIKVAKQYASQSFIFNCSFISQNRRNKVFQTEAVCREILHFKHDFIKTISWRGSAVPFGKNKRNTLNRLNLASCKSYFYFLRMMSFKTLK